MANSILRNIRQFKLNRFTAHLQKHLRLWIMIAGIILSLMLFEEVVDDVFHDPREGDYEAQVFDKTISGFVGSVRSEKLTGTMVDLTALGSVSVILVLSIIFFSVMATYRDYKGILYLSVILAGAGAWPTMLKPIFARPRPEATDWLVQVSELSFPSGHSFGAAATYVGLAYYARKYSRYWSQEVFFYFLGGSLALLVGISRIYLGVHYPTDVLAGLSGGVAWGLSVSLVFELLSRPAKLV